MSPRWTGREIAVFCLPELVIRAGVELLLLETDAPWLPPEPHRGQRNESALMVHTRDRIASLLDLTADDVVRHTTASFVRVFGPLAGTDAADPDAAGTTESPAGP